MIDVDFKKTIVLDFESRSALVNGENIKLTSLEFRLICIFYKKRGKVLTRSEIGNLLHGSDIDLFEGQLMSSLAGYVRNLMFISKSKPLKVSGAGVTILM